ncbi:MAG: hypothetical protein OXS32_15230 [Verrucomicrobiales bacterium]|nr:hypothetical protein [Verrucomicrobiales bacterium]
MPGNGRKLQTWPSAWPSAQKRGRVHYSKAKPVARPASPLAKR